MFREMVRCKLAYPTVTQTELWYEGSITIDQELLRAADIREGEKVHVFNANNGERFHTYAIAGPPGSGTICLNGPAARKAMVGDRVVVVAYALFGEEELDRHRGTYVKVDEQNRLTERVVR